MKKLLESYGTGDWEIVFEAMKKEASRQVGSMEKWMAFESKTDRVGLLWMYEDEVFPIIVKARRYRMTIYAGNKNIGKIRFDIMKSQIEGASDKVIMGLHEEISEIQAHQAMMCWKIMKIYLALRKKVSFALGEDEEGIFTEKEYDYEERMV